MKLKELLQQFNSLSEVYDSLTEPHAKKVIEEEMRKVLKEAIAERDRMKKFCKTIGAY